MDAEVVIGLDPHKDVLVAVAVDRRGRPLEVKAATARPRGYRALLAWARKLGPHRWAVEDVLHVAGGLVQFLLAEDELRAAGCDEPQEGRGEVAVIVLSLPLPGQTEGLAGRRSGPDRPVLGHAGKAQRMGPAADPGEEMALRKTPQLGRLHVENGSFVHLASRKVAGGDEDPQPGAGGGVGIDVIDGHQAAASVFVSSPSRSALTAAKLRPSPSRIASRHVSACQRSTATST